MTEPTLEELRFEIGQLASLHPPDAGAETFYAQLYRGVQWLAGIALELTARCERLEREQDAAIDAACLKMADQVWEQAEALYSGTAADGLEKQAERPDAPVAAVIGPDGKGSATGGNEANPHD